MKNQRRFKAPNYRRGCLLAKAFGVSAANSGGKRTARPRWLAGRGFQPAKRNFIFFEMLALKILRKGKANRINNRE